MGGKSLHEALRVERVSATFFADGFFLRREKKSRRRARVFLPSQRRADCMYKTVRVSPRVGPPRASVCAFVSRLTRRVSRVSGGVVEPDMLAFETSESRSSSPSLFVGFSLARRPGRRARAFCLHLGHAVLVQDAGEEILGDVVAVIQRALERARAGLGVAAHAAALRRRERKGDE